jgi:xanthine dehydrogenase accessory factor
LGDRALVFADGHMEGFVGGSCSRDIVRRQALGAIRNRQPVLLQIRHDSRTAPAVAAAEAAHECSDEHAAAALKDHAGPTVPSTERVVIPMSCSSEGAVDVYIEPRVPLRRLIVVGFTPVAEAVARMASALDYRVVHVVVDDEMRDLDPTPGAQTLTLAALRTFLDALDAGQRETLVAVVASQGHYDELALEVLQRYNIAFMGLLASRRRAANVLGVLTQQGVPADRLALIRYPVGIDIGARSPGEVAVSILAEIIGNTPSSLGWGARGGRTTPG